MRVGKHYNLVIDHITKNSVDIDGEGLSYTVLYGDNFNSRQGGMQVDFDGAEEYDAVRDELDEASKHLLKAFKIINGFR